MASTPATTPASKSWRPQEQHGRLAREDIVVALALEAQPAEDVLDPALQEQQLAVHPTLEDFAEPDEPPSLRRARRLLASAASLDVSLRRYRVAVLDSIRPRPAPVPDDSPF